MKRRAAIKILLVTLSLLVVLAAAGLWRLARQTLPVLSGKTRLPGVEAPIEIVRDAHGIPHIYARSPEDAYFGLGYAHAQDRLWQMEQARRVASGTLAEVIGERGLESDRLFRTLGLSGHARANYARLDAAVRAALDAYARGVNTWIQSAPALPIEFSLLRHTPDAWTPADSLQFIRLLAWQLSGNWGLELWRVRLHSVLSIEQLSEFAAAYPGYEQLPLSQLWQVYAGLDVRLESRAPQGALGTEGSPAALGAARLATFAPAARELGRLAPADLGSAVGSNNWVIGGSRSLSGKPLLANDPHLPLTAPSPWYLAHLEAPGLRVIGATLPALPGVILGHNEQVAWGFTNTFPDTQDLYLERIAPGDPTRYFGPNGWLSFDVTREVIHVRGAPDVELELRHTRHGPVISDVSSEARALLPEGYVLALHWTALRDDDQTAAFPLRAAAARTARELREAARAFHAPAQNIVYADSAGAIGFVAAGRMPLRHRDDDLRGTLPAPGWLARYDWTGLLPFEELPAEQEPASGRIVTANQRITPAGYPHWLGADWGPPYRATRIGALLDARPRHSLESFAAIQCDVHSGIADRLLEPMLRALPEALGAREQALVLALRRWDLSMQPDAVEPLLFAAWVRELARAVYADELGELFPDEWSERPEFLRNVLADVEGQTRWCDDRSTPARESCSEMVNRAWSAALADLEARFGADPAAWSWGKAHPSISRHRLLGEVPVLSWWANLSAWRGGDGSSVNVGSYRMHDDETPFSNSWGPGLRLLYDLSDLDHSRAVLNSGQSGHILSPFYRDMNPLWARGQYVSLTMDPARIRDGAIGTIELHPR